MKKLLLTFIILLISGAAFAQDQDSVKKYKVYDIDKAMKITKSTKGTGLVSTWKGRRVYFDYRTDKYLLEEHFARKYGMKTVKTLDKIYLKGELFEQSSKNQPSQHGNLQLSPGDGANYRGSTYKLKMRPYNLVIGASVIGVSATAYMLTSSVIEDKIKNETDLDKISSLSATKRTVGYICAGTSLAGVIVVLTGLHREYGNGVNIGHNFTVSDAGGGISITKKF